LSNTSRIFASVITMFETMNITPSFSYHDIVKPQRPRNRGTDALKALNGDTFYGLQRKLDAWTDMTYR
jgi:hypothetical protein